MTLKHPVLELTCDVDQDGSMETGVFEFVGDVELTHRVDVNHMFGKNLGNVNAITTGIAEDVTGEAAIGANRVSYYLDLGAGSHAFEINFLGWEGAGSDQTFGDPDEPIGKANATGSNIEHQEACLQEYLRIGEYDSTNEHAKLRYGEYSDGTYAEDGADGVYDDYLHVTIQDDRLTRSAGSPRTFDGSILIEETNSVGDALDIFRQVIF
jgi:hypothetical protein